MDGTSSRLSCEKLLGSDTPSNSSDDERSEAPEWPKSPSRRHLRFRVAAGTLVIASILLNIALLAMLHRAWSMPVHKVETGLAKPMLYSPANDLLETVMVKFDSSIYQGVTAYQGLPNETNNKLWLDLYDQERTHLSYEQALLLPNKTLPEKAAPGKYVVLLNVFHNLHCLDALRQVLYYFIDDKWTAHNNPYTLMSHVGGTIDALLIADGGMDHGIVHLDHCIDALRQQEMCLPDITPNVFQYSPWDQGIRAFSSVVHECRNFTKIKEWARQNRSPAWEGWAEGGVAVGKCSATDQGDDCLRR